MSKAKNRLTILRLDDGSFVEQTSKTKKLITPTTEVFEYVICKYPFDLARYITRAKQERQRILRHRGVPSVK